MQTTKTDTVVNYINIPAQETRIEVEPLAHGPTFEENRRDSGLLTVVGRSIGRFALLLSVLSLSIPILQLIVGRYYRHQCPIEPKIPYFLYIGGIVGIIAAIIPLIVILYTVIQTLKMVKKENEVKNIAIEGTAKGTIRVLSALSMNLFLVVVTLLLNLFLFIWLIFGTIWTFRVLRKVNYDEKDEKNYCHRTLYVFTLVLLVFNLIQIIGQCFRSKLQTTRGSKT